MSLCCRTCDHRNNDVHAFPSAPSQLDVCLVTLTFRADFAPQTKAYNALNTVLNNIIDGEATSSHPTTFTSWSPCLTEPNTAIIVSTAKETCSSTSSPVFQSVLQYLTKAPNVQHVYLDYSVLALATSSPEQRMPVEIIQLQAPNPIVAAAIGKQFGWDPKRSSLSNQMPSHDSAGFSRPGDLIKDFWAWAELQHEDPMSPSTVGSSFASSRESLPGTSALRTYNSDEKNLSLPFPEEDDEDEQAHAKDDETLLMIFKWSSHADAERFKHPLQVSHGRNGQDIRRDLWEAQVAHPLRQLQASGARMKTFKLEFRAVEPRLLTTGRADGNRTRLRSGSKRLSIMASGLSEKVSGFWK